MVWDPQEGPQSSALLARFCDELFFGGERGGGKSDFQLGYQEDGALLYPNRWRGIMFRKTYAELEELQGRAMEIFPASGAIYKVRPSQGYPFTNAWYWPSGSSVKMRYIEHERDYGSYHGHQYTGISFDEITEYASPAGLLKMLSTLRNAYGVPCTMRATGNPGGVGHAWVKARYIDVAPPYTPHHDPETGFMRLFVPSKTADNQILLRSDPRYRNRIIAATHGNEALRKAWLEGDWNIVAGAFFDCWRNDRHVVKPFNIPKHWIKFRSGDWGSARPFSFGWWAIVPDDYSVAEGFVLPRGCLVRYREWYGIARDDYENIIPNQGLKLTAEEVALELLEREKTDTNIEYGVLDPATWKQEGGPSIAERMHRATHNRIVFRRADNARTARLGALGGWDQMRGRLKGEGPDRPMMVCFSTCLDSVRTIPCLQHDKDNIEDVFTEGEDHAGDDWRYAAMSRPYVRLQDDAPPIYPIEQTLDQMFKRHIEKQRE